VDKYLGNKAAILPVMYRYMMSRVPGALSLSDPFTGTTNVARFFRSRGFDVHVADLNRFSYVLANAYLTSRDPFEFSGLRGRYTPETLHRIKSEFLRSAERAQGRTVSQSASELWLHLRRAAEALAILQCTGDRNERAGPVYQYFTRWGSRARYSSMRGSIGKRNYFSKDNALVLDGMLAALRSWWKAGRLTRFELDFLLTSLIEEVVITANVTGTFHDFNRDKLWPNALQRFTLRMPVTESSGTGVTITNADARDAVRTFGAHDICYIDPPYNFRQYTSYYHFLNFVAAFPHLPSITRYLDDIDYVRGQNMKDDEASDFSNRDRFLPAIRKLVESASAPNIFLSYYSGRNHWNHWSATEEPTDLGLNRLTAFFSDRTLFSDFEVTTARDIRKNFQSRVGEKKELVDEYLFYAMRRSAETEAGHEAVSLSNRRLRIDASFPTVRLSREHDAREGLIGA
jgi:adenine-specific DNA-methyltransferase